VAQYLLKRFLLMIVTLLGITIITFLVTRLTPGEPAGDRIDTVQGDSANYDDLVEQNRRNLGLNKPMILNFEFNDRYTEAEGAVRDYIRPVRFWQEDAERRLRLSGAIALPAMLEFLDKIQTAPESVDHLFEQNPDPKRQINPEVATERLLYLLPSLAQFRDLPEDFEESSVESKIKFWRDYVAANEFRWETEQVKQTVTDYLEERATVQEIQMVGGYAVPYLMRALKDEGSAQRANAALSALTGFNYLSSPDAWDEESAQAIRRWNSLYQRERIRFTDYGILGDTVNIFVNTQYGVWLVQLARLDFGDSYKYRRPVTDLMVERLPVTVILSVLSIIVGYLIAIPLGIFSAIKRYTKADTVVTVTLFVLYSLPNFWVAVMLLLLFTGGPSPLPFLEEWPAWFPTRGLNSGEYNWRSGGVPDLINFMWHLALPTICMTYGSLAFISRQMRSSMLEVINEDYIRTAKAKGLSGNAVIFKHAFRNSLIPILTISSGLLPQLIAGSIVVELIFTIPGMGLLTFEAILNRDFPIVNAVLFFSAALTLVGILVVDLAYALVDPRIKYE